MLYNRLSCDPTLGRAVTILKIAPIISCFVSVILLAVPISSSPPWTSGEENATGHVSFHARSATFDVDFDADSIADGLLDRLRQHESADRTGSHCVPSLAGQEPAHATHDKDPHHPGSVDPHTVSQNLHSPLSSSKPH